MIDINQPLFSEQIPHLPSPEPNPPNTPPPTPPGGYKCNLGPEPPRPLEPPSSGLPTSPYRQREDFVLPEPSDAKTGYTPPQSPQPPPNPPSTPKKQGDLPLPEPSDAKTGTTPPPRPKTPPNTPVKKCSADYSSNTTSPFPGMIYVMACA